MGTISARKTYRQNATVYRRHRPEDGTHLQLFFFNDPATTEIYTLPLHAALPISLPRRDRGVDADPGSAETLPLALTGFRDRSEEHTSELQSRLHLVCRLLLEKKKNRLMVFSQVSPGTRR